MDVFSSKGERTLTGIILIVAATVLMLSGLNWLDYRHFFSEQMDIVLAFILLGIGVALAFTEK
ncbi:MAG: hypothetical protein NUV67_03445 [archaeon]|nr:hypothetical protein [archaeon]